MFKSNQKKWVDWCEELFEINNWKTKQVEKHSVIFPWILWQQKEYIM